MSAPGFKYHCDRCSFHGDFTEEQVREYNGYNGGHLNPHHGIATPCYGKVRLYDEWVSSFKRANPAGISVSDLEAGRE